MARHIEKAEQVIDRNEINEEGLNRLRAAIVHQAVDDYASTFVLYSGKEGSIE